MRQEMIAGFAEERKSGDKRFSWLLSAHLSTFIAIVMPPRRINEIVKGLRGITVDTALRLATFFGTGVQSWINLQTHCDLELVRQTMTEKQSRF